MELDTVALTQFPDLSSVNDAASDEINSHDFVACNGLGDDIVIRAWALLLKAYTGEDILTFSSNNGQVRVDSSSAAIEKTSGATAGKRATAVYLSEVGDIDSSITDLQGSDSSGHFLDATAIKGHAFSMFYARQNGDCRLYAKGGIPAGFLKEIALQLRSLLHNEQDVKETSDEDESASMEISVINPRPTYLEGPQLLHQLVFHHGCSSETALDFRNADGSRTSLSYVTLRQQSLLFAQKLRDCFRTLGIFNIQDKQRVIPVLIPQSAELYVALLGILEAGAAFCPLNLDAPEERVKFIIQDVAADVIVSSSKDVSRFEFVADVTPCVVDDISTALPDASHSSDNPCTTSSNQENISSSSWAYIMYTSGSTGQPKGVILSHLAVTQSLLAHDRHIPKFSRFLQFASPTFDVSMFEIFFTFQRGCTLVGCNRTELLNDLPGLISKLNVDAAELTPTVAGTLLRTRDEVPSLKLLLTIGEMLTRAVIEEFGASSTKSAVLYGMYGPTEAAIHCTAQPQFAANEKVGLIGQPFDTVSAFIAEPCPSDVSSASMNILPIGQIGELVVGGTQLAQGYLNRKEQTEKVFFEHPTYGMLYRTGDKARMLPNGVLECLGRIQAGQVKLRGQRIELGEIEQAAMRTPGCQLAIASILRDNLVLFCLVSNKISEEDVHQVCCNWLLPHMIPNEILLRSSFPQLPSGKVDKKTLEKTYKSATSNGHSPSQDVSDPALVQEICEIISTLVGADISANAKLSKEGVDSLRAIQIASEIRRRALLKVGAVDILRANSVQDICTSAALSSSEKPENNPTNEFFTQLRSLVLDRPEIANQSAKVSGILPCTPLQTAMLAETMKDPRAYCNWVEILIDGKLTADEVQQGFVTLLNANEILRSGFIEVGDPSIRFAQIIWEECTTDQVRQTESITSKEFSIDSSQRLLRPLEVFIIKSAAQVSALVQIHHALFDGWSMDLMLKDLNTLFSGSDIRQRPSFRHVSKYYFDISNSSGLDDARDHWESLLEDVSPAHFPSFAKTESSSFSSSLLTYTREVRFPESIALETLPFHPQVFIQLALAYLWASYIGSNDVVFGTVSAGRALPVDDIEDIIGPCIATLPSRVNLTKFSTIDAIMSHIQNQNRLALEYSMLPLREIKRLADLDPTQLLFDVVFIWQESIESKRSEHAFAHRSRSADFLESKLLIEAEPQQGSITLKCSQREEYLPGAMVSILLEQISTMFLSLGRKMQSSQDIPISDLWHILDEGLLSEGELQLDQSVSDKHLQSSNQFLKCRGAIVSDPLLNTDQHILPLGGVGRLFFENEGSSTSIPAKWKGNGTSSYEHDQYGRLQRSNCLARLLPDKVIQLFGTSNGYVAFRNQLVETNRISDAVQGLASVRECRTLVISEQSKAILVSFWVPQEISSANGYVNGDVKVSQLHRLSTCASYVEIAGRIMDHLRESFPKHLLPSFLIPVSTRSLNDISSLDFQEFFDGLGDMTSLSQSQLSHSAELEIDSMDKIHIERTLAEALAETIKGHTGRISRNTSFFRLGLDSVSAISFSRRLKTGHAKLDVDVATILRYPSVSRLASQLMKAGVAQAQINRDSEVSYFDEETLHQLENSYQALNLDVAKIRPCTPLQEGMLANTGSSAYFNHSLFSVFQPARKFQQAFAEVFRRHDILRTCFSTTTHPQLPFSQVVLRDIPVPWRNLEQNLENLDLLMKEIESNELHALDSMKPPLAITEINSKNNCYLLLSLHHALYDAEAMGQLLWEIERLLNGDKLPSPPSFDAFLHETLYSNFEQADAFWLSVFKDFRPKNLFTKDRKSIRHQHESPPRSVTLTKSFGMSLKDVESAAQDQSVTLSTLVQLAWSKVIAAATRSTDICFGQVLNGRAIPVDDVDRLVAPCFNTVPVRVQFHGTATNVEISQQLQKINAEIHAYAFMPIRRLQSKLNLDGNPLFDTLVLMQKPIRVLDESIWSLEKDVGDMGLPLVCEVIPDPDTDSVKIKLHTRDSELSNDQCSDLMKAFMSALGHSVTAPQGSAAMFDVPNFEAWTTSVGLAAVQEEIVEYPATSFYSNDSGHKYRTGLESIIQQAIAGSLTIPPEQIALDKSVFRLGVDSITAIQIAKRLRQEGVDISAQDVMDGKSINGMVNLVQAHNELPLDSHQQAEEDFSLATFNERHGTIICRENGLQSAKINVLPCTPIQAGMISQFLNSNGEMYLNQFLYELPEHIDTVRLREAWKVAFERHQMLASGFAAYENSNYPFVMISQDPTALDFPWSELDITDQANERNTIDETLEIKRSEFKQAILNDLKLPPWRILLLSLLARGRRQNFLNLTILHALYDAESLRMILSDVESHYRGNCASPPPSIEPLLSHILRQTAIEASHRDFWQSTLHEMSINKFPNLNRLYIKERAVQTITAVTEKFHVIAEGCRSLGVTLQAALQVAWARLLADYVAEPDIVFGLVLAGRESDDADEVAFPSTNTVPCRLKVHDDINLMLQEAMNYNSAVKKHQHASLPQIARWAGCQGSSMFDTLLVYQAVDSGYASESLWHSIDEQATVEYPLSIEVTRDGSQTLEVRLVVFNDIIPAEHATILAHQYLCILQDVTVGLRGKFDTPYDDLSLLSKLDPATPEIRSKAKGLHDFVQYSAELYPDRLALEFSPGFDGSNSCKYTYSELNTEGNKIANLILDSGVNARSLLAVCFDKCAEASFAIVGILKAGCAYVALDPTAPNSRISFILADSEAVMLLTTSELAKDMSLDQTVKVICVDAIEGGKLDDRLPPQAEQVQSSDPCYCLYTSGSSGTPKGCVITHENAVQAMLAFQNIFAGRWDDSSRWLQFASFHFDVSVLEQFWSWSVGICVVTTPRDVLFSDLVGILNKLQITHIDLTPSLARLITPEQIPTLCRGVFITGGEQLKQEVLDAWGPIEVIHNGYGPTECTIGCTMYPRVPANGKPSNIGWQFENVGTYVFKPGTTDLVPRGGVGELCISGKLVGQGYLKRPELTEKSFAYIKRYDERVYRTNDLVRMLHDGSFEFLGRNDDQVKLRGQRLELGEINNAMMSDEGLIEEVNTIIVKRDTNKAEQLVSFIAIGTQAQRKSKEEHSQIISELKEKCETKLPTYMVPSHFILLESIPLTANNKSDMNALKRIFDESISTDINTSDDTNVRHAISEGERQLSEIVASFLEIPLDKVSPASNLFELGLDSISAFALVSKLRGKGYENAKAAAIMKQKSIKELAIYLSENDKFTEDTAVTQARYEIASFQRKHKAAVARSFRVSPSALEYLLPCTPLQHGMIAKALQDEDRPYFNTLLYSVNLDAIDEQLSSNGISPHSQGNTPDGGHIGINGDSTSSLSYLRKAIAAAAESVSILKTTFVSTHEGYAQAVFREPIPNTCKMVRTQTSECMADAVQRQRKAWLEENNGAFRLPFQACLLEHVQESKIYMILNIFHGLYDATSLPLLLQTISERLTDSWHLNRQTTPFHEALPYGPLRKHQDAKMFWEDRLTESALQPLNISPDANTNTYNTETICISGLTKLEETRRRFNVTHQALVQAAWTATYQEWCQFPNTFGMVVSGRSIDLPDPDQIIGPMFNTIPFSVRISTADTWRTLASKSHDFNLSALPYQHTPLRDIQKWCGKSSRAVLFDTLFVFQKLPSSGKGSSPTIFTELDSMASPDYALAFEVAQVENDSLKVTVVSRCDISNARTSSALLQRFKQSLIAMLEMPDQLVSNTIDIDKIATPSTEEESDENEPASVAQNDHGFIWTDLALSIKTELAELSGVDEASISARTSIYQLGLDSIDAIRLSSAMKNRGVNLSVSSILQLQSILEMTKHIGDDDNDTSEVSPKQVSAFSSDSQVRLDRLQHGKNETIIPATPLQEAIVWAMLSSHFQHYFNHDVLKLWPSIDIDRFKAAWKTIYESRAILRTSFCEIEDPDLPYAFVQVINDQTRLPWDEVSLSNTDEIPSLIDKVRTEIAAKVKDGGSSNHDRIPFRLTLATLEDESRFLILSLSHALYDGWSLNLLHQDVMEAYQNRLGSRPKIIPSLNKILQGSNERSKNFWTDFLSEFQGCLFPLSSEADSNVVEVHRLERSSRMALSTVREFCKSQNIGIQALGHLCWSIVLATYTNSLDVGFGVVLSGRDDEEAQQIMFPTMNTVVVRCVLAGSRAEMLQDSQFNVGNLMQHQFFPLREISATTGLPGHALFNTLFIYQKRPGGAYNTQSLYDSFDTSSNVEYPVCVEVEVINETLIWRTACSSSALAFTGVEELLDRLDSVLKDLVSLPEAPAVQFYGKTMSVCGLPRFEENPNSALAASTTKSKDLQANANGSVGLYSSGTVNRKLANVVEVLSMVSKVPEPQIDENDTIYHLGLDSISLIKVASGLRRKGVHISVGDMLKAGTVKQIVLTVQSSLFPNQAGDVDTQAILDTIISPFDLQLLSTPLGLGAYHITKALPATPAQVFFLSHWQSTRGTLFFSTFEYRLEGEVELSAVQNAWTTLVNAHNILRTTFVGTDSSDIPILQVVLSENPASFVDLPQKTNSFEHDAPFTLPVRLETKPLRNGGILLRLRIHHALYDAVSLPILIRQLEELCSGRNADTGEAGNDQFTEFVALTYSKQIQETKRDFWTDYLGTTMAKQVSHAEKIKDDMDLSTRTSVYQPRIFTKLDELTPILRKGGIGLQSFFLAVTAYVYARSYALGRNETKTPEHVILGVYLANRSHQMSQNVNNQSEDLTSLAAPTLNLVPLKVISPLSSSIIDSARQIQKDLQKISSFENASVGLWEIDAWTGIKIDCFVNFLTVPESNNTREVSSGATAISLNAFQDNVEDNHDQNAELRGDTGSMKKLQEALRRNVVQETYIPSVDIEAAVREGAIDIGIFGPSEMLSKQAAEGILEELKQGLENGAKI